MEYSTLIRYIKKEVTPGEKKEVEEWLSIPLNRKKYERVLMIWEVSKEVTINEFKPDAKRAWNNLSFKEKEKNGFRRLYKPISIAAGFLLIFTLSWFYLSSDKNLDKVSWITEETTKEEMKELLLPDGTKVWLNNSSVVEYPEDFKGKIRKVKLQGEAFFDVARDESKPFQILANNSLTEVLGTSFNINAKKKKITEINVLTGKVAFSNEKEKDKKVFLIKGEKAILTTDSLIKNKVNPDMNFLAWKTGILKFSGTSLENVFQVLSDYYKKDIFSIDSSINSLELTATFDKQTIEEVLNVICLTLDTKYTINESYITINNKE